MADFNTIKTTIDANINTNGNQAITGAVMNTVLKQMVDSTEEQLTESSSKVGMNIIHTISGKYITTGGSIVASSGDVGIFVFEVPQAAFLLQIPKTGNQYHSQFAFSNEIVDSGTLQDAQGVGNENAVEIELDGREISYRYIYISCRPSAGLPQMYIKSPYSFDVNDRSLSASKLQLFDTYPVCLTAAVSDMNAVMDEIYLLPEYSSLTDVVFKIRPYSRGFILGAYKGVGNRLWGVRAYEIKDKYKSGDLIPLVVDVTTSSTSAGTLVGYAVVKDVDALAALPGTTTEGEIINIEKSSMLFLNPKISTLLSLPTKEESETDTSLSLTNGVEITLPSEITAIVGDNMQIFWRSIVSAANPYIFDIYAASSVGKSYPRYFEFKPTSDMSGKSYQMAVYVRANDGSVVAEKTTTIKVISAMSAPSATKNVLCVGASATAGGQWVGELARRLTATSGDGTNANPIGLGLNNISFVGRKQGTGNPVNLEATGGWRVQDYASQGLNAVRFYVTNVDTLSLGARYLCNGVIYVIQEVNVTEGVGNIRCTLENTFVAPSGKLVKQSGSGDAEITFTSYEQEKFNPFWNDAESRLDFSSYANEYCDGHIDCMIWHCGVNDLSGASIGTMMSVIENITTSYRDIFRAYHQQFPNGKVVVSSVPVGSTNGGFAANYGASAYANYFTFAKKVQAYATALSDLCAESEFANYVIYSPVLEEFDAENGYPTKQTAVNNRSSVTEAVGTNGVHPTTEGSYMVADAIYRTFNNLDL